MIIEQTFTVDAAHEDAAAFFFDVDRMSSCIPGVEGVKEVAPDTYEATLAVRLGPIRAAFKGSLALNREKFPDQLEATGEGRDRATGSTAKVAFTANLQEIEPNKTEVSSVADVALRGRMAQFGTGIMRAASEEMVREFAANANHKLALERAAAAPAAVAETAIDGAEVAAAERVPVPPPTAPRKNRGIVSIMFRRFLRSVAGTFHRAGNGIERRLDGESK